MNPPVVSSLGHQLMAVSIDEQIRRLLHKWVAVSLDGYKDGTSVAFEPESELVVNLTYYMLSFISMKPTPGMQVIYHNFSTFVLSIEIMTTFIHHRQSNTALQTQQTTLLIGNLRY